MSESSSVRRLSLVAVGKARQHHRCLELVHARFSEAPGRERQWLRIQWQARNARRTAWWFECIGLARAGADEVEAPDGVAHLSQLGIKRCRAWPPRRPDAKRPCRVR